MFRSQVFVVFFFLLDLKNDPQKQMMSLSPIHPDGQIGSPPEAMRSLHWQAHTKQDGNFFG